MPDPTADSAAGTTRVADLLDLYNVYDSIQHELPSFPVASTSEAPPAPHNLALLPVRPDAMGSLEHYRQYARAWGETAKGQRHRADRPLAQARYQNMATGTSFAQHLGRAVEDHVVILEDDSTEGRRILQQRLERTVLGSDARPVWDPEKG